MTPNVWSRQAVGQQHNNNTPATYMLEVRRAVKKDLAAAAMAPPCLVAEGDKSAPLAPSRSKPGGVFLHCTSGSVLLRR